MPLWSFLVLLCRLARTMRPPNSFLTADSLSSIGTGVKVHTEVEKTHVAMCGCLMHVPNTRSPLPLLRVATFPKGCNLAGEILWHPPQSIPCEATGGQHSYRCWAVTIGGAPRSLTAIREEERKEGRPVHPPRFSETSEQICKECQW
jgi:hypothetical protein